MSYLIATAKLDYIGSKTWPAEMLDHIADIPQGQSWLTCTFRRRLNIKFTAKLPELQY